MTISSTTNRVTYTGNGSTVDFAVSFPFFAKADLVVIETIITTGVQTTKTLTTHYTISGTTDALGHYPNGGTVTAVTAPASTVTWTIYRDPTATQSTDFVENDSLPVESLEAQLDYLTMIAQRTRDLVNRTLKQPEGDSATIDYLPTKVDRASKYLAFSATGDPVATAGTTSTIIVSTFAETILDDTSAAAVRTTIDASATTPADNVFRVTGSADATKKIAFEADGIATATTRTVTAPNRDVTLGSATWGSEVFTGNGTFTTPSTTVAGSQFKFTVIGGGAGGGGAASTGGSGGGGGAGATAIYYVSGLSASQACTVTVGAGAAGGSAGANNGTAGNLSSIVVGATTVTANGGSAGLASGTGAAPSGAAGGVATNGTINITGGMGACGHRFDATVLPSGGHGGGSSMGGGGAGAPNGNAGSAGQAYGAGGGGGAATGAANAAGGDGKQGLVIAEWII